VNLESYSMPEKDDLDVNYICRNKCAYEFYSFIPWYRFLIVVIFNLDPGPSYTIHFGRDAL
jgi:hypothetical protein